MILGFSLLNTLDMMNMQKKITFLEEKDCNMFIKDRSKKLLFYKSMINSL